MLANRGRDCYAVPAPHSWPGQGRDHQGPRMDIAALRARHPEHWTLAAAIRTLTLDAVAAATRAIRHADGDGRCRHGPVRPPSAVRSQGARLGRPRRFILSAGHGSMLLYSLLYLTGYADITLDQIRAFVSGA